MELGSQADRTRWTLHLEKSTSDKLTIKDWKEARRVEAVLTSIHNTHTPTHTSQDSILLLFYLAPSEPHTLLPKQLHKIGQTWQTAQVERAQEHEV